MATIRKIVTLLDNDYKQSTESQHLSTEWDFRVYLVQSSHFADEQYEKLNDLPKTKWPVTAKREIKNRNFPAPMANTPKTAYSSVAKDSVKSHF